MSHRLVSSSSFKISSIVQNLNFRVQAVKVAIVPCLRESSSFIINDNLPSSINGINKSQDQANILTDAMILSEDDVLPHYINKDIEVPEDDVGPGANKHGKYKNVEYFRNNRYSFYDKMQQALAYKLEREESEGAIYMMDQLMEKEKAKLQTDKIVEDTIKATEASEGLMARSMSTLIYFPLFLRTEPYSMDADNSAKTHIMGWIKSLEDKKNKPKDSRDDKMPEEEISAADNFLHDNQTRLFADESKDFDEEENAKKPSYEHEDIFEEQTDKPPVQEHTYKEPNMSDITDAEQIQQEVINLLNSKLAKRIQQNSQAEESSALEDEQNNLYEISLDKLEREAEMNVRLKEHRLSGGYVRKQSKTPEHMDTDDVAAVQTSQMHQKEKYLFNKAMSSSGRQESREEPLDPFEEQLATSGEVEQEQEMEQLADRSQMMASMHDDEQLDPFEEKLATEEVEQQTPAIPQINHAHTYAYTQNESLDPFEEKLATEEVQQQTQINNAHMYTQNESVDPFEERLASDEVEEQETPQMAQMMPTKVRTFVQKEPLDPFEERLASDELEHSTMEEAQEPLRAEINYAPAPALSSEDYFEQHLVRAEGGKTQSDVMDRKDPLQKLLVKPKVNEAPPDSSDSVDPLQKHLAPEEVDNASTVEDLEAELKAQRIEETSETMADPLQKHLMIDEAENTRSRAEMAQMSQMMADQPPTTAEMEPLKDPLKKHLVMDESDYSQKKPENTAEMSQMNDHLKQHLSDETDYSELKPQNIEEMSEVIEDKLQEHLVPVKAEYSQTKSQNTVKMTTDPLQKHLSDETDYSELKSQNMEEMSEVMEDKLQEHLMPDEAEYSQKKPQNAAEMSELNDPLKQYLVLDETDYSQKKFDNTAEMSQLNDQLKKLLSDETEFSQMKTAEIAQITPKKAEGSDVHNLVSKPIQAKEQLLPVDGDGKAQETAEMSQMIEDLRAAMANKKQLYSQDLAEMSQMMSNLMAEVENHMRSFSNAATLNTLREQKQTGEVEHSQLKTEVPQKIDSGSENDSLQKHLVTDEVDKVSTGAQHLRDMAKLAPMMDDTLQKYLVTDTKMKPKETPKKATSEFDNVFNAAFKDPLKDYLVIDKAAQAPVVDLANKDPLQDLLVMDNQQEKVDEKTIMSEMITTLPDAPEVFFEDPLQKHVLPAATPEKSHMKTQEMYDNATMHVLRLKDPLQKHLLKQQKEADDLDDAYMSALSRKPTHPIEEQQFTGDVDYSQMQANNTSAMSSPPTPPMEVDDDAYMHALANPEQMAPLEQQNEPTQDQLDNSDHADSVFDNLVEKQFTPDAEEYEASNDAGNHHESPFDRIVGVNQCLDAGATFGLHSDPSEFSQIINSALDGMAEYEEKFGLGSCSKNIEALTTETITNSDPDIKEIGSFSKPFIIPFPEFTSPEDFSTKEHPQPTGAEESNTSAEESLPTITLVAREMSESEEKHPSESEIAQAAKELIIAKRAKIPVIGKFNGDTEEMEYNSVFTRPSRFPRSNARTMDEIVYRSSLD